MTRPLRLEFPGALYHVTSRGDRREDIYLDDLDRQRFLDLIGETCQRFNWRMHAYCLMTNHYHLVIETPEGNLSRGMRQLNGVYTQRFNRRHRRVGHVFQGRYTAILVDRDAYLLELGRYVVLNPVRARMVKTASQWPWSSYRAMIGKTNTPDWLETKTVLGQLGHHKKTAQQRYIYFVKEGKGLPAIWENLTQQIYLGDEHFVTRMQDYLDGLDTLIEVPIAQRRPVPKPLSHYRSQNEDRKQAMICAYETGYYTLKEIANFFNVHYSTVSRTVNRHKGL